MLAILIHKAIGKNLYCVFVDNGLLRKNEANEVKSGTECGISVKEFNDFQIGDFIEVFSTEEVAQSL